jgi:cysteine desulfurase / selenocysteine lyase
MEPTPSKKAGPVKLDPARIKKDFPIFDQEIRGRRLIYLDNAATTQKPRAVIDAVDRFYAHDNANVHRAVHALAERATAAFENARTKIAAFIGAPDATSVIWTRGTTEAINLVAYAWARRTLQRGDEILLTEMEHHSNLVPWQMVAQDLGVRLRFVPLRDDYTLDRVRYRELLTERTKLVGMIWVSNVLGTINPVKEMIQEAHAVGARVLLDAAQAAPNLPVDVRDVDCDFLALSGHKMLGPTGVGVLYGRAEILESMAPFHGGGEMILEVTPERSTYKAAPHKFEAGTPPIAQAVGLAAAVEYLEQLGMENVHEHEHDLSTYARATLERLGGVTVHGPRDARGGATSFMVEGIHPHDLATILDRDGIAIRAGHHCAQPLMKRLGVSATARASFHVYNAREDVDALAVGIEKARRILGVARQPA